MSFFQSLLPKNTPQHIAQQGEIMVLRERILQIILLYLAGFGVVTYVVAMRDAFASQELPNGIAFTLIFSATVAVALYRKLAYNLRASSLLLIIFGAAIWSLIQYGLGGNARIFLFTFATLVAVLMGYRANTVGQLAAIFVLVVFAVAMSMELLPSPPLGANADSRNPADWALAITYFILLVFTATMSLTAIIRGMEGSLKKQSELTGQLERERANLEIRITDRTKDLERRLLQIRTSVDITRSISTMLDPDTLLQSVADLMQTRMDLYYIGVFLLDDASQYAVLHAGSGEAGRKMIAAGHRLQIGGSSMIGWTIVNRQARIALDVGSEAIRFSNPNLPLTRSELALPLIMTDKVVGALSVQSEQVDAFDKDDILIFQIIADSLAVAIENTRLFQQTQRDLEEIRSLNRQYLQQAWSEISSQYGNLGFTFDNPQLQSSPEKLSKLEFPITLRDQVIGSIEIDSVVSTLAPEDLAVVEAITTQTALALESARLLEESQRRAAQEEKINDLSAQFSKAIRIDDILKIALIEIGQIPSVAEVSVNLLPPLEEEIDNQTGPAAASSSGKEPVV